MKGFQKLPAEENIALIIRSGKKLHLEPKQKLPNLITLRRVTFGQCIRFLLLCNKWPQTLQLKAALVS